LQLRVIYYQLRECCLSDVYRDSYTGASELMMKEYDDDVSDVYQQHSCYRRSSVAEALYFLPFNFIAVVCL
ncbi:hypothetical protein T07_12525, partial [Trichinella nelsoni]